MDGTSVLGKWWDRKALAFGLVAEGRRSKQHLQVQAKGTENNRNEAGMGSACWVQGQELGWQENRV